MNDREIEAIIQEAEEQVGTDSLASARFMVAAMVVPTLGMVFSHTPLWGFGAFYTVCGFVIGGLWADGKKLKRALMEERAYSLWQKLDYIGVSGEKPSPEERQLLKDIERIYERDPQGKILPLPQAIRLTLAWKQQQRRLQAIGAHIDQLQIAHAALQEKQALLRELGDENLGAERTLASLNADITPLQRSYDALRASCARLESLVAQVETSIRRRELHREIGELAAQLPLNSPNSETALDSWDDHLDLERQITREIETYLQLERETDAQLRDL